ncbi:MAG: tRNA threonylcarbamoyladenosine biosynthesis protein TsaB, partial [Pseudohongiellaceae bacterium]
MSGAVLAFDASTFRATAALLGPDGSEWGVWQQVAGERGTAQLAPAVAELLAARELSVADLAGVTVGLGPGSYTGLRSAIAFARALCWPSARPLVGLPSVASAAAALLASQPELQTVITVVDARRGECYRADYERSPRGGSMVETLAPCLVPAEQIEALEPADDLAVLTEPEPVALTLARLARPGIARGGDDPTTVLPLYLKRSHAEIALE